MFETIQITGSAQELQLAAMHQDINAVFWVCVAILGFLAAKELLRLFQPKRNRAAEQQLILAEIEKILLKAQAQAGPGAQIKKPAAETIKERILEQRQKKKRGRPAKAKIIREELKKEKTQTQQIQAQLPTENIFARDK